MKSCELCKEKARMNCESDQANLCWDCDAKVHSANFLVARHSRNLLCHLCQSPTPWSASGAVLAPTISVCEKCVKGSRGEADDGDEEEGEEEEEEEVVEDNQIVPAPPPSSESSSSSGGVMISRKRRLENASISSSDEGDQGGSSSQLNVGTPPSDSSTRREARPPHPTKIQRTSSFEMGRIGVSESGILESLRRFHREELGWGLEMAECCTSSKGPLAVDLSSCDSS